MSADMTKCLLGGDYNQLLLHRTPFFCLHWGNCMGPQVPGSQTLPSSPRGQDDLVHTWMQWDRCSYFRFLEEVKFEPVLEGGGIPGWGRKKRRYSRPDRAEHTAPSIHCPEVLHGLLGAEYLWGHSCARTGSHCLWGPQSFDCGLAGQGLSRQGEGWWQAEEAAPWPIY